MNKKVVKIGEAAVDSGLLMIVDPGYAIDFRDEEPSDFSDHAHSVQRHKDGSLWQFTYGKKAQEGITPFPGSYAEVIPQYGKSPNQLIKDGEFTVAEDIDPRPHLKGAKNPNFNYGAACNMKDGEHFKQLCYMNGGLAVSFRTGVGDGTYPVFAEIGEVPGWGERVLRVWVDFFPDDAEDDSETTTKN